MASMRPQDIIPHDLLASIERQTGARLSAIVPRAGGGASRQGAEVTLQAPDGSETRAWLAWDSRAADPRRLPYFTRETAVLRALSGPMAHSGVRAARLLAAEPAHLALLTALVPGSDRPPSDPVEADAVARDMVAQLAALHRTPVAGLGLDGFGDPAVPVSRRIADRLATLRAENLATAPDPVIQLALDWLQANVPADTGPAVLVHGDAGPGNFLHAGGRVTALVDWELSHFGDPLEDLAQIWVRMLFQPFMPMCDLFRAYEAAGGAPVDVYRVRYHRLYFQLGFTVSGHADHCGATTVRPANLGVSMMFHTAHMRVIVESLADLCDVALPTVALPDALPGPADRSFAIALDDLRDVITPRLSDQQAAVKAKSLARLVKYWRARDRFGAAFDAAEAAEAAEALGRPIASATEARRELGLAVAQGRIPFERALRLCHARVTRDTAVMADAMGAFARTTFPPLDPA
ncbi:MAG: phosphotransferase family protein [Sandarakinorhabdus sp.]|nr:phosphotransferase family protein [Sandarakinorhabdus sp.]